MTALEIAIGVTSVFWLVMSIIAAHQPGASRPVALPVAIVSTFGTVWFIARLWGFA